MEGLVDLLPLLFVAGYYLLRARRRSEQQRRREHQPPGGSVAERREPSPFQQFLQQVEDAVAESVEGPREERPREEPLAPPEPPAALPSPLPAPPIKPVRPAPEFRAIEGSFDAASPTDHVRHGFGRDNPLSEERFEQLPPHSPRPRRSGPLPDPHGLTRAPAPIPNLGHWRSKLRDPKAAREAFVLQTIFGPRGGRKADRR